MSYEYIERFSALGFGMYVHLGLYSVAGRGEWHQRTHKVPSEEYKKLKTELMQIMWSNKAVTEAYEPGSTFKIITVAAALDAGAASISDTFSCTGHLKVGGWRIKCHKTTGHGSGFSLAYGLQMSCNPTMMQIAEKIGVSSFYDYVERFGYFEKKRN